MRNGIGPDSTVAHRDGATAVIVVNFGSHQLLSKALGAAELTGSDFRVVVVDNATTKAEREAARTLCTLHGWDFTALPTNGGFGAGMNVGLRRALELGAASFVLLNPDVQVGGSVFSQLREHVHADPYAVVSPVLRAESGRVEFSGSTLDLADGRIRGSAGLPDAESSGTARPWLPATCLALHRELLAGVGPFYEPYFLYWEDVDLTYRCGQAGARLVVRHDLEVVHVGGGTQGSRRGPAKSNRYYRYNCRNRLIFAARHLDRRRIVRWMMHTPAASWRIVLQGGRRQLLRSPGPLLAAVSGSVSGLAIAARALLGGGRRRVLEDDRWRAANALDRAST